jgi:CPA1 family monovalent cation:H+ antiporter
MAYAFWDLTTFLVNGGLFVLVGMQIPRAVRDVDGPALAHSILIAVVVAGVLLATRMLWVHLSALAIRAVDRRQSQRARRVSWRIRTVSGWAGFRGAVSLAAALSVPLSTPSGGPVGERDLIIFTTAAVILLTMLFQGTTLPLLLRWAGLRGDPERVEETRQARLRTPQTGLAMLPDIAARKGAGPDVVERVISDYQRHLDDFREPEEESESAAFREDERRLRLAVLEHKRREVTRMRDAREIDDTVLRELQATLDIEEIRLRGPLEFE